VAELVVVSDRDRGGYAFLSEGAARHVQIAGLRTRLSPLWWLRGARRLKAILMREDPALVWAHSRMGVLLLRWLILTGQLGRQGNEPLVAITFHGLPFGPGHHAILAAIARRVERLSLRRGPLQHLIFLSEAAQAHYREAVGASLCARHICHVLPNCSDLDQVMTEAAWSPPMPVSRLGRPVRHIVMTGRVARQKNLMRALRILVELPGNYRLSVCGAGTDSADFRKKARRILGECGLGRVDFLGEVADVRPILAGADCYLLTSLYEGMPVGALEAFEAGLPLALCNIPGTVDLLAQHPLCVGLSDRGDDTPQEDALRIVALTEHFCAKRAAAQAEISDAWRSRFSFAARAPEMRRLLVQDLLPTKAAQAWNSAPQTAAHRH
tara:strand:+ start:12741 stop:13886 length:1146 start_codon:yes stop_codon:yes gene_type:complete